MAKPGRDAWERSNAGDQPRHVGVPQIVKPERRYMFRRHRGHQLPPYMGVEVAVVQRQTSPAGEHEVVSRSALNSLLEEPEWWSPEPRSMKALREITKQVRSTSGRELRTSQVIEAESALSIDDLPEEVTVSPIAPFTPGGEHWIRCMIRSGVIPVTARKPYKLNRDLTLAYAARVQDHQGAAA
jgi:hypothetical protein